MPASVLGLGSHSRGRGIEGFFCDYAGGIVWPAGLKVVQQLLTLRGPMTETVEWVMVRRIGTTTLEVVQGDITTSDVDAIVNAANNHLWMGAGVAGAIKRQGGQVIEDEAMRQGPIPIGTAVVTSGGRLKARYVIHAAAMGQDLVTNAELLRQATRQSLQQASALGLTSIALPALGTGVGGFPVAEAARVMIEVTCSVLHNTPQTSLQQVIFVLFTPDAREAFERALAQVPQ